MDLPNRSVIVVVQIVLAIREHSFCYSQSTNFQLNADKAKCVARSDISQYLFSYVRCQSSRCLFIYFVFGCAAKIREPLSAIKMIESTIGTYFFFFSSSLCEDDEEKFGGGSFSGF